MTQISSPISTFCWYPIRRCFCPPAFVASIPFRAVIPYGTVASSPQVKYIIHFVIKTLLIAITSAMRTGFATVLPAKANRSALPHIR